MDDEQPTTGGEPIERAGDLPVTVVGGYLGSGKTTLVNHLLRTGTERVAVLVNDFGQVDIDAALIERADGDTIALANGCICCSLVDGLAAALDTVTSLDPRPDRLVIEASGVADPAAVAAYGHGPGLGLDAVIVLVDVENVRRQAVDKYVGDTVTGQLRAADVVVVNKTDLVARAEVEAVVGWLSERVDRALIIETSQGRVDPAVLFGRVEHGRWPAAGASPAVGPDVRGPSHADERYQSWSWIGEGPVARSTVETLMAELPDGVIRAKGILWLSGQEVDRPHVLQRVGGRWSLRPLPSGAAGDAADRARRSRLVAIGRPRAIDDGWLGRRLGP